jgi:hypothetical protein
MNRTLELRDICGYLPHGLKAFFYDKKETSDSRYYGRIMNMGFPMVNSVIKESNKIKPILRPLADLYRTVTHNGKEIIPIVECAKIATSLIDFYQPVNRGHAEYDTGYEYFKFFFDGGFQFTDSGIKVNQIKAFDCLHELKIDFRNLIASDLAIDANTLEINPYK